MTEPNEKHRQAAREIVDKVFGHSVGVEGLAEAIAAALADAFTAGREEKCKCCGYVYADDTTPGASASYREGWENDIRHEAYQRGRDEAIAQAGEVLDNLSAAYSKDMTRYPEDSGNREIAMRQSMAVDHAQRIVRRLAPSSGPTYEQRLRAEIAEAVEALPRLSWNSGLQKMTGVIEGGYYEADDVLAAIQRSEK